MDSVTLLWIFSLLGAAGFAATGYWYGRMKVAEEVAAAEERARATGSGSANVHEAKTIPPPDSEALAKIREEVKAEAKAEARAEIEAENAAMIEAATAAATEAAAKAARERDGAERADLEQRAAEDKAAAEEAHRQLSVLREELRVEILARTEAEKRSSDLTSRLVSASQQITGLRAKAGLTPEAPGVRNSLTPQAPRVSMPPSMTPQRMAALAPGLFGELEELRREIARLKSENETLRVAAFVKRSE